MVGIISILGLSLAADMETLSLIPKDVQVDWEAILNPRFKQFNDFVRWLYDKSSVDWEAILNPRFKQFNDSVSPWIPGNTGSMARTCAAFLHPGNTGSIARTCAATAVPLHLVKPLGFDITDSKLKRAGLDYWPYVVLKRAGLDYWPHVVVSVHAADLRNLKTLLLSPCSPFPAVTAAPGPLGFDITDSKLKRAGLDYWPYVVVNVHDSWRVFMEYFRQQPEPKRLIAFSKRGSVPHHDIQYQPGGSDIHRRNLQTPPTHHGDPHFRGADGTRFDFNGLLDRSFCLLSDRRIHINMGIKGYRPIANLPGTATSLDENTLAAAVEAAANEFKPRHIQELQEEALSAAEVAGLLRMRDNGSLPETEKVADALEREVGRFRGSSGAAEDAGELGGDQAVPAAIQLSEGLNSVQYAKHELEARLLKGKPIRSWIRELQVMWRDATGATALGVPQGAGRQGAGPRCPPDSSNGW
ncbi:unnamed protein product [Closterium sp. NIES-64]|nr:unnamed protein product [Closterium sp. NIES-64]